MLFLLKMINKTFRNITRIKFFKKSRKISFSFFNSIYFLDSFTLRENHRKTNPDWLGLFKPYVWNYPHRLEARKRLIMPY